METTVYRGETITIWNDTDSLNPRKDWDNGTVMVCRHSGYDLGNDDDIDDSECSNWKEVAELIQKEKSPIAILPLYLIDHSGISMSTGAFSCPWDSGQVGFIYVDEKGAEEMGWTKEYIKTLTDGKDEKYAGKTREEILIGFMQSDVKVYDDYITGSVYGYTVEDGEDPSCGGYFGYDFEKSGLLPDARASIDNMLKNRIDARIAKLKNYIKSKVPVIYRTLPAL